LAFIIQFFWKTSVATVATLVKVCKNHHTNPSSSLKYITLVYTTKHEITLDWFEIGCTIKFKWHIMLFSAPPNGKIHQYIFAQIHSNYATIYFGFFVGLFLTMCIIFSVHTGQSRRHSGIIRWMFKLPNLKYACLSFVQPLKKLF
jgi:hypothetical protein